MASFPSSLPAPTVQGYQLAPVDQVVRTDMEVGAPRARRRTSARLDRVRVAWQLTDGQMQTFRSWFEDAVNGAAGGAQWFTMTLALGLGGLTNIEARIVDWEARPFGALNWEVSAELEVR